MLRTNLSTHPFYNVRAVQVALGALTVIVIAVSAFNAIQVATLSASQRTLGAKAAAAEAEAARLRTAAAAIRAQINPRDLTTVAPVPKRPCKRGSSSSASIPRISRGTPGNIAHHRPRSSSSQMPGAVPWRFVSTVASRGIMI